MKTLDKMLGTFFQQLAKSKLDSSTNVIILGDHGEDYADYAEDNDPLRICIHAYRHDILGQ